MKTIYLVSVQPENSQSMPKVYFAETSIEVEDFLTHYELGSVIVKRITSLPVFTGTDAKR